MTEDLIDLSIGRPQNAVLPREVLRRAAAHRFAVPDGTPLQYGAEQGALSLRTAVADFLTRQHGVPVDPDALLMTSGASHALDLICAARTRPGDVVFVEAPSYFFGLDILRARGLRLVPVPTDDDGLDTAALARLLDTDVPTFLYTIPTFHNPTGVTMSPPRRRHLLELADRYDFTVVADEVYQFVCDRDRMPAPIRAGGAARAVSLGSFSKILGPGLRLGWIECDAGLVGQFRNEAVLRSGGGVSPMTGAILESALVLGLQDDYLARIRHLYGQRRRHFAAVLSRSLPNGVRARMPEGGYFVWLRLPDDVDATVVARRAAEAGVGVRPGSEFSVDGSFANCLRLCFVAHDEDRLTVAAERLGPVLRAGLSDLRTRRIR